MTPPRHIMMTTDAVGGVWVYATTLAKELAKLGTRVTLVNMGPPPRPAQQNLVRSLAPETELLVTDLELEWLDPEGKDAARASLELLRIADRIQPDLVHLNGYRDAANAWPCPVLVMAHSCVVSWWQACRGSRPDERRWHHYAKAVAGGLDAAKAWVAPTVAFRDVIFGLYLPATAGRVIHNGISSGACGIDKQPVILASGRFWDEAKNLAAVAAAAPALPWPVQIAGSDSVAAPQDGIVGNVDWLGEIPHAELQARMRAAAIYVAPARYEPFGLGILEAAAAGCALVLSDIPTLRELWDGAAVFVPPDEIDMLHAQLLVLCGDPQKRRELHRAARERARRYSAARMCKGYSALYDILLSSSAKAAPQDLEVPA